MKTYLFADYSENNQFNQNKFLLALAKERFISDNTDLQSILFEFTKDESHLRFNLCQDFNLFGNNTNSWCSGGEDDIKALCQSVLYGYQDAEARHFKSSLIVKARNILLTNDKKAFFELSQSIYRSAQANSPYFYDYEPSKIENIAFETDEEEEQISAYAPIVVDWFKECQSQTKFIKSGNHYKKKIKSTKTSQEVLMSLFDLGSVV